MSWVKRTTNYILTVQILARYISFTFDLISVVDKIGSVIYFSSGFSNSIDQWYDMKYEINIISKKLLVNNSNSQRAIKN